MFVRFGAVVFADSQFQKLEFNEDGTATLYLLNDDPDGIPLSKELAEEINQFFFADRCEGTLEIYVAKMPEEIRQPSCQSGPLDD